MNNNCRWKEGIYVETIKQKYAVIRQIGEGLSCVVYLAEHKQLHHLCAVKCISKEIYDSEAFEREARLLRSLTNRRFPMLYDCDEDDRYWYLIEEYIDGPSLKNLKENTKIISQEIMIETAMGICEAIEFLHKCRPYPIIYLDLKPEHVILTREGIKILDLGSAIYLRGKSLSGKVSGTEGFASPEQLQGIDIDERSDIYSIGAVLYWFMTGNIVCTNEEIKVEMRDSKRWETILCKCLETQAERRYATAGELRRDIQLIVGRWGKRLEKSLRIAVIGSQSRVGTTHFAIGMSRACNDLGRKCLYEERNDSGAVQNIYEFEDSVQEYQGVYCFRGVELVPKYGEGILEQTYEYPIQIMDYGYIGEEMQMQVDEADCIIAIIGAKEWEMHKTRKLVERYRQRKGVYYVVNAGELNWFRKTVRELRLKKAFYMPFFGNPFILGRKEKRFYKKLVRHITREAGKDSRYVEKETLQL